MIPLTTAAAVLIAVIAAWGLADHLWLESERWRRQYAYRRAQRAQAEIWAVRYHVDLPCYQPDPRWSLPTAATRAAVPDAGDMRPGLHEPGSLIRDWFRSELLAERARAIDDWPHLNRCWSDDTGSFAAFCKETP